MEVETRNFGTLQIVEDQVIVFEEGIPGFEDLKKYILMMEDEDKPFAFLQSVEDGDLCLTIINPMELFDNYSFDVDEELLHGLGNIENNLTIFCVAVIPNEIEKITANLKAPILINVATNKGIQVVLNTEDYQIKHPIYNELLASIKVEEGGESC